MSFFTRPECASNSAMFFTSPTTRYWFSATFRQRIFPTRYIACLGIGRPFHKMYACCFNFYWLWQVSDDLYPYRKTKPPRERVSHCEVDEVCENHEDEPGCQSRDYKASLKVLKVIVMSGQGRKSRWSEKIVMEKGWNWSTGGGAVHPDECSTLRQRKWFWRWC